MKKFLKTKINKLEKLFCLFIIVLLEIGIIISLYTSLKNEGGLTVYEVIYQIKSNNSILIYELKPNWEQKFYGYEIRLPNITTIKINSDGFRDREFSIEKPNNTFRIICLGDSFTFGQGVELNESYPKVLERKLNSLNNGVKYEVLNFGVPGYNTWQEVEMLDVKGLKYSPDMVIFGYVHNDIVNTTLINEILEKTWKEHEDELNRLSPEKQKIKRVEISDSLLPLFASFENKNYDEIIEILKPSAEKLTNKTKEKSIKIIITNVAIFTPETHLRALKNISLENGWYMTDNVFSSVTAPDTLSLYPKKDPHPNPFAHELIANGIFNYLIKNNIIKVM